MNPIISGLKADFSILVTMNADKNEQLAAISKDHNLLANGIIEFAKGTVICKDSKDPTFSISVKELEELIPAEERSPLTVLTLTTLTTQLKLYQKEQRIARRRADSPDSKEEEGPIPKSFIRKGSSMQLKFSRSEGGNITVASPLDDSSDEEDSFPVRSATARAAPSKGSVKPFERYDDMRSESDIYTLAGKIMRILPSGGIRSAATPESQELVNSLLAIISGEMGVDVVALSKRMDRVEEENRALKSASPSEVSSVSIESAESHAREIEALKLELAAKEELIGKQQSKLEAADKRIDTLERQIETTRYEMGDIKSRLDLAQRRLRSAESYRF